MWPNTHMPGLVGNLLSASFQAFYPRLAEPWTSPLESLSQALTMLFLRDYLIYFFPTTLKTPGRELRLLWTTASPEPSTVLAQNRPHLLNEWMNEWMNERTNSKKTIFHKPPQRTLLLYYFVITFTFSLSLCVAVPVNGLFQAGKMCFYTNWNMWHRVVL